MEMEIIKWLEIQNNKWKKKFNYISDQNDITVVSLTVG